MWALVVVVVWGETGLVGQESWPAVPSVSMNSGSTSVVRLLAMSHGCSCMRTPAHRQRHPEGARVSGL